MDSVFTIRISSIGYFDHYFEATTTGNGKYRMWVITIVVVVVWVSTEWFDFDLFGVSCGWSLAKQSRVFKLNNNLGLRVTA